MIRVVIDITILLSIILAIIYSIGFIRNGRAYQFFTIYLLVIAIIQMCSYYFVRIKSEPNLFLSHYCFILQFLLMSLFYREMLKAKWIYWIIAIVCGLIAFQYIRQPELYQLYNGLGIAITQLIIVVYAVLYLYRNLKNESQFLLMSSGLVIYFISSILIFASGNLFYNINIPKTLPRLLNDINAFLYLAFQILIFIEWYRNYRVKLD